MYQAKAGRATLPCALRSITSRLLLACTTGTFTERTGVRAHDSKLLPIKDVIRDLQQRSKVVSCDDTIDPLKAIHGNEAHKKETRLELEEELAVEMRGA